MTCPQGRAEVQGRLHRDRDRRLTGAGPAPVAVGFPGGPAGRLAHIAAADVSSASPGTILRGAC
eukprot:3599226-Heterocapsa_arctica.AAC.1